MTTGTKHKILIVDDDKFLLDMYSIKFSEEGFEVVTAVDGADALDKLSAGFQPDMFLIDLLMPKIDGFQLIAELKAKNFIDHGAVIILSNLGQPQEIERGLSLGVDGYIVKATATPSEVVKRSTEIVKQKKR